MNAPPVETPRDAARRLAAAAIRDGFQPTGLHEYQDAEGSPVFWRIRCKHPDGRKWIRPMHWNGSGYANGEPVAPPAGKPLYRLPELLAASADVIVWLVEGEACADALGRLGLVATTSGSADSAGAADWTPLQGRRVRAWPDNDVPGAKYADAAAERLRALGNVVEVLDVAALNLPPKGDCVDWLAANPEAIAIDVNALPVIAVAAAAAAVEAGAGNAVRVELIRADTITPEAVQWLWHGWLAAGKMQILGGQPGTGKTTIAMALAATVSSGGRWPDGSQAERGSVVIWSGEDDPADTLVPRLRAAGADTGRIHFIAGMCEGSERRSFDPATDSVELLAAMERIGDVRLLVVDPIVSAVAGDSHKNAEVRRGLQPLVDVAQRHRCALLGITHFTKGTAGREPLERITGSLAFGALARLVMVTAKAEAKDDEPSRRFLARAKSNIGPDGGGYVYDLQQGELSDCPGVEASWVLWGDALEGTARELLADAERREDDDDAAMDACGFLRDLLGYGARQAKEIYREAESAGFSRDAMKRAKRRVGAEAVKQGMVGGWVWRLPKGEGSAEGSEGSKKNHPLPSLPSESCPLPSTGFDASESATHDTAEDREVWEL